MDLNARVDVNCGRKDGQTDGRMDGWTDGRMENGMTISHLAKAGATKSCSNRLESCLRLKIKDSCLLEEI